MDMNSVKNWTINIPVPNGYLFTGIFSLGHSNSSDVLMDAESAPPGNVINISGFCRTYDGATRNTTIFVRALCIKTKYVSL